MVNILTVCIDNTALWDLITFSLIDYIYMYFAGKTVVFKFWKKQ